MLRKNRSSQNQLPHNMNNQDFTTTILVDQTPDVVFNAVTNPRAWWSEEIEGNTNRLNAEWNYHYKDVHVCKMKITELVPDTKVVWHVLENAFNFVKDQSEWVGTNVVFDISRKDHKTLLRFTH